MKEIVLITRCDNLNWATWVMLPLLVVLGSIVIVLVTFSRGNCSRDLELLIVLFFWLVEILSRLILDLVRLDLIKILLLWASTGVSIGGYSLLYVIYELTALGVYFLKGLVSICNGHFVLWWKCLFYFRWLYSSRNSSIYRHFLPTRYISLKYLVEIDISCIHVMINSEILGLYTRFWLLRCIYSLSWSLIGFIHIKHKLSYVFCSILHISYLGSHVWTFSNGSGGEFLNWNNCLDCILPFHSLDFSL